MTGAPFPSKTDTTDAELHVITIHSPVRSAMSINDDEVPPPPPDEPPPGEGAAVDSTAITIEPNVGLEEMALTSQPDEDGFAFAVGDPQPRQCSLCCCDDALVPPKEPGGRPRKPKARVIACFMNMPLKCFRRNNGVEPYFVLGEYRFCFRMVGNQSSTLTPQL